MFGKISPSVERNRRTIDEGKVLSQFIVPKSVAENENRKRWDILIANYR